MACVIKPQIYALLPQGGKCAAITNYFPWISIASQGKVKYQVLGPELGLGLETVAVSVDMF